MVDHTEHAILKLDNAILSKILEGMGKEWPQHCIIALDPGETTGFAVYYPGVDGGPSYIEVCQVPTKEVEQWGALFRKVMNWNPKEIRIEDYRIYNNKAAEHISATLHTPQLIGALKYFLMTNEISPTFCMAQQAKQFWTDDKLQMCDLWVKGKVHGRDALRHLLYKIVMG